MKTEDMELDIRIDPNRLDEEWTKQPSVYFHHAAQLASAKREVDEAKADLELTKAELDQAIRSNPGKYGLDKTTEKAIEATIPVQDEYQKALDSYHQSRHKADVLQAAVSSLDQKKHALHDLVVLRMADYYSSPKAPEGAKDKMEEVERKAIRKGRKRSTG